MAEPSANGRGALLMMAAMALYVVNDSFVKLVSHAFPVGQILAVRGFVAVLVVALLAHAQRAWGAWRQLLRPIVGVRCLLEVLTAAASTAALALMPLASATAIMMVAPVLITVASFFVLRQERLQYARLLVVLAGFVGAVCIVRPSTGGLDWGAMSALLCAVSLAARDLVTRRMPGQVPSVLLALGTTTAVALAGAASAPWQEWQPLHWQQAVCLSAAALAAALGNYALIAACRNVDLSAVTPFRYTILVWAVLAGWLLWNDLPDAASVAGMALIAASGLYLLWSAQAGHR